MENGGSSSVPVAKGPAPWPKAASIRASARRVMTPTGRRTAGRSGSVSGHGSGAEFDPQDAASPRDRSRDRERREGSQTELRNPNTRPDRLERTVEALDRAFRAQSQELATLKQKMDHLVIAVTKNTSSCEQFQATHQRAADTETNLLQACSNIVKTYVTKEDLDAKVTLANAHIKSIADELMRLQRSIAQAAAHDSVVSDSPLQTAAPAPQVFNVGTPPDPMQTATADPWSRAASAAQTSAGPFAMPPQPPGISKPPMTKYDRHAQATVPEPPNSWAQPTAHSSPFETPQHQAPQPPQAFVGNAVGNVFQGKGQYKGNQEAIDRKSESLRRSLWQRH